MTGENFLETFEKRAAFWAKILEKMPGVRAVFLSGSVAAGRAAPDSDIDFFLVAEKNRIWTARFFVFLVLKLSGRLAKPDRHAGRMCPNHFISADALEITEKDAYSAYLFSHNRFLAGDEKIWGEFVLANEKWIGEFGEYFRHPVPKVEKSFWERPYDLLVRKIILKILEKGPQPRLLSEEIGAIGEYFLKKIQKMKIERNPEFKTPGAKIILTDTELRFHPKPKNTKFTK